MSELAIGGVVLRRSDLKRDPNPLQWRRVRHRESGRMGRIEHAWLRRHTVRGTDDRPQAAIRWDDLIGFAPERVALDELEVLDAPSITVPVFVRKVIYRGHKEQVAEWLAAREPLSADLVEAGGRRYVEFDPNGMSYQRWRVIYMGPQLDQDKVDRTPDQAPGAADRRSAARDAQWDDDPSSGGW